MIQAAKLIDFQVSKISQCNQLAFIENSLLDLSDFMCQIDNFIIKDSNLVLNENLLNKQIFKEIVSLTISNSVLNDIQNDTFKSFYKMKAADFELLNFDKFIQISSQNDWMKYINYNVTVNLNDENDIKKNLANLFELSLTDFGNKNYKLYTAITDSCKNIQNYIFIELISLRIRINQSFQGLITLQED